jgi:peroxiredoxin
VPDLTGGFDIGIAVGEPLMNRVLAAMHENADDDFPRLLDDFRMALKDIAGIRDDRVPPSDRTGVIADVQAQVSAPTAEFHDDGVVEMSFRVRAWTETTSGPPLPRSTDGRVRIAAPTLITVDGSGGAIADVDIRDARVRVAFEPTEGSPFPAEDVDLVERVLRNFVRGEITPANARFELPDDVRAVSVLTSRGGRVPTATFLMSLTSDSPSASERVADFLADGDAAVGVGASYLDRVLRDALVAGASTEYRSGRMTARPRWDEARLEFDAEAGRIDLVVSGTGVYVLPSIIPDIRFRFTVRAGFSFAADGATITAVPAGDVRVRVTAGGVRIPSALTGGVRSRLDEERSRALIRANDLIRRSLNLGEQLSGILRRLHPAPPAVRFSHPQIRSDGVVVPLALRPWGPTRPVVAWYQTAGDLLNARVSKVPGGTIDRFIWRWGRVTSDRVEEHRFVTERDAWGEPCLTVEGTRLDPEGRLERVRAEVCGFRVPILPWLPRLEGITFRQRRDVVTLPMAADGSAASGEYDPFGHGRVPSKGDTNLLVHFADGPAASGVALVEEALKARRGPTAAVVAVVVGSQGAAGDVVANGDEHVFVATAADTNSRWSSLLGVKDRPATMLVGPARDVRWEQQGQLSADDLATALDEHLVTGGRLEWWPLKLALPVGVSAPDVELSVAGRPLRLHKLRGTRVTLCFWTAASASSIEELRRLSARSADDGLLVAVNDGDDAETVQHASKEGFDMPLFADPQRRLSSAFGVNCWPTTVTIDEDGVIAGVCFGRSHDAQGAEQTAV